MPYCAKVWLFGVRLQEKENNSKLMEKQKLNRFSDDADIDKKNWLRVTSHKVIYKILKSPKYESSICIKK